MIFHQLFEKESSTYTYLIGDAVSGEAVLIDPVSSMLDRDLKLIQELGLKLTFILDTHVHADHITASAELKKRTGAKIAISQVYHLKCADLHLSDGQELAIGTHKIKAIATPGHTLGCMTFLFQDMMFTGDTLLVRGCGRTDFQDGSAETLFISVREKLFSFPDETIVFPGHDYKGFTHTSLKLEKQFNPRLNLSLTQADFVKIMSELNLTYPKQINEALPANLQCGR
ncbi:MAG: MBL fold metallo-hydrolase [Bdellovibrionales bacterium]|nr:MBL fold metallo-hydrolase [Bdellovibrionales bacterium]